MEKVRTEIEQARLPRTKPERKGTMKYLSFLNVHPLLDYLNNFEKG